MGYPDFILEIQKKFTHTFNLITKVGPVFRDGNDPTTYKVSVEFCPVNNEKDLKLDGLRLFKETVDSSILGCVIAGNIWKGDRIIQNIELARDVATFEVKTGEEYRSPRALFSQLGIVNDKEVIKTIAQYFIEQNIPITGSSLYSFCLKFPCKNFESSKRADFVLIPCAELVRFLFLQTGALSNIVLNGNLESVCNKAYFEHDDSGHEHENVVIIVTDKKYTAVEEYIFASILYNDELSKSYRAISEYLNSRLMFNQGKAADIKTYLPSSHEKIHACGVNFVHNDICYFYVNQIYSIDYKASFNNLYVLLDTDTRKGEITTETGRKVYENKKVMYGCGQKETKVISTEVKGDPSSIINPMYFQVQSNDIFHNNEIPPSFYAEKGLQNSQYNGKTIVIKRESNLLTTKLYRDGDSQIPVAKISNGNGRNEENNGYSFALFTSALEKIKGRKIGNSVVAVSYFKIQEERFCDSIFINKYDEKTGMKILVAKITCGDREVVVLDFTGVATKRIACIHNKNESWSVRPIAILEFISLIKYYGYIPQVDLCKSPKMLGSNLKWILWERLNVGNLTKGELEDKLLGLVM